jgi:hypothetical protein
MSDEEKPSPEVIEQRRRWFEDYCRKLDESSVRRGPEPGQRFACPCCGCLTLEERGGFDICLICFWEDDGQDDRDATDVRGGPNGPLSLEQARRNYAAFGACDERSKAHVRPPLPEEKGQG